MLCVSIHDVAPATWPDCLRLVQAVREVADIPLTWLVVPSYHFRPERSPAMEACLDVVVERGDELALHGYSHLDTEADGGGLRGRFLRSVYTRREGEFAALDEAESRRRLELGLAWFAERNWTPTGFIPPAWLLGKDAWRALRDASFAYTTTFSHFHCLRAADGSPIEHSVLSPSLVYAARNRGGRLLSPRVADATARMLANAPLVRFSLHPPDARYPELVRHIQRVLEQQLAVREAVTKAECARRLAAAHAIPLEASLGGQRAVVEPVLVVSTVATLDAQDASGAAAAIVVATEQENEAVPGADAGRVVDAPETGAVHADAVQPDAVQTDAPEADALQAHAPEAGAHEPDAHDADAQPGDVHADDTNTESTDGAHNAAATGATASAPESGQATRQPTVDFGNRQAVMPTFADWSAVTSARPASAPGPSRRTRTRTDSYRKADSRPAG